MRFSVLSHPHQHLVLSDLKIFLWLQWMCDGISIVVLVCLCLNTDDSGHVLIYIYLPLWNSSTVFLCSSRTIYLFIYSWPRQWYVEFPGQGLNTLHGSHQSNSSDKAGSLTRWAIREFLYFLNTPSWFFLTVIDLQCICFAVLSPGCHGLDPSHQ